MQTMLRSLGVMTLMTGALLCSPRADAQATLDGMPRVAEWTDFENQSGEMPPKVWDSCDLQKADRIGIKVDFQNGISSYAVYHGVANLWNALDFSPILPDSSGGFLGSCGGIHWLFNDGGALPLAWDGCTMAYSNNFDLEYANQYGSHFRADSAGWVQATFQTYCGAAGGQPVTPQVGLWWNPGESGSGYNIDVKNGVLVMTVFSYKATGEQEWYITSGPITNGSFTGTLNRYVGGQCIFCAYNGLPTSAGNAGVVTINFTSPVAATMLLPGGRVTTIQPEAF